MTIDIFLLRGLAVLAILPPFEGWDEYQHLANIAYVAEYGRTPTLRESTVPRGLYPAIAALPHCRLATGQVQSVGGLPYQAIDDEHLKLQSYWDGPPPPMRADAPDISLYQAQHGPLYYRLMAPVFRAFWDSDHPLTCIYVLRLINVVLGAAAVGAFLWAITQLVSSVRHRIWIALLLAVQPLFLLNTARIANDALAVFLGVAATALMFTHGVRCRPWAMVAAGMLAGLAVLSKSVAMVLLPLAIVAPLVALFRREKRVGQSIAAVSGFWIAFLIVTGGYFYSNWKTYGVAVPMQEAVANRQMHRGFADMAKAVTQIDWGRQLRSRVGRDSLWVGGWSYLALPGAFRAVHEGLIFCSLVGLAVYAVRGRRRGDDARPDVRRPPNGLGEPCSGWIDPAHVGLMGLLVAGSLAGLAYHTLQSKVAYDTITTNVWYAAMGFPWMIALFVVGASRISIRGAAPALVAAMLLLNLLAECYGLFGVMTRGYSGLSWSAEARARLATVHPAWLTPDLALPLQATAVVLAVVVFGLSIRFAGVSQQHCPPRRDPLPGQALRRMPRRETLRFLA